MFCPNCGTKLVDNAKFCSSCGTSLAHLRQADGQTQGKVDIAAGAAAATVATTTAETAATAPATIVSVTPVAEAATTTASVTPAATTVTQVAVSAGTTGATTAAAGGSAAATTAATTATAASAAAPAAAAAAPAAIGAAAIAKIAVPAALVSTLVAGIGYTAVTGQLGGPDSNNSSESALVENAAGSQDQDVALDANGNAIQAFERPAIVTADLLTTTPVEPNVEPFSVDNGLANVINKDDVYGYDADMLAKNGFYVELTQAYAYECEFYEVYEMNRYSLTPNFVTTDSIMHTYHLYYVYLQKKTELNHLYPALLQASHSMLAESLEQLEQVRGTAWEGAALRNVTFFAVGTSLLDPDAKVPDEVSGTVQAEIDKIYAASGLNQCEILGDLEDYSQYAPRSYYAGNETLERYFRAMMWYGRINFTQSDEDLDRSAALITLALNGSANQTWEAIYTVTSFFAGASDDCGYYEYMPLIISVWGNDATAADLAANEDSWQAYHALTAKMPAPAINSVVVYDEGRDADHQEEEKGFRFMGQRFSIDEAIFQNLVYNKVGANANGQNRGMPNALDVPAALGSDEALGILEEKGETSYKDYPENMTMTRAAIAAADMQTWGASLSSQWLYTLLPLLEEKGEGYPQFMQSHEWTRKNLQSFLGSYTELKHDTALYAKQVMVELGGGPLEERDDRGYVEPEPELYGRLATLAQATSDGLDRYGLIEDGAKSDLALLTSLAQQLQTISEKELRNELPTDDEFELIRSYGGQLEHFWEEANREDAVTEVFRSRDFPAALVTDVATNADSGTVLELGTGSPSQIYVVVPVDGVLRIAVGSCFSFYQFEQPMSDRLTDTTWREMMGLEPLSDGGFEVAEPAKEAEDWTRSFQSKQN